MTRIAVLMTVYNRKEKTLQSLRHLHAQTALSKGVELRVILVDDGSTDGTSEAVVASFPGIELIHGTGSLYWCGGMRLAYQAALQHPSDYHLWLNDDTLLFPEALDVLLEDSSRVGCENILVGSVQDPDTGEPSYGGHLQNSTWHPFHYQLIAPKNSPQRVQTMNGNCVLIPTPVAQSVGNLDSAFTHGIGDYDYAYRAGRLGVGLWISSGYVGVCRQNGIKGTWKDKTLSVKERWKRLTSPKGLPLHEWKIFTQRYGGIFWPVFWLFTYIKVLFRL